MHHSSGTYAALEGMLPVAGTYFLGIGEGAIDWKSRAGSIFSSSDWASSQFGATDAGAGMKVNSVNRSGPGAGVGGVCDRVVFCEAVTAGATSAEST